MPGSDLKGGPLYFCFVLFCLFVFFGGEGGAGGWEIFLGINCFPHLQIVDDYGGKKFVYYFSIIKKNRTWLVEST